MTDQSSVKFLPSGDTGLTVQFDGPVDAAMSRRVIILGKRLIAARVPGLIETVPTYRSLLVHYNPLQTTQNELIAAIEPLIESYADDDESSGHHWRLPVCFDGPGFAPDLDVVAEWSGAEPPALIDTLLSTRLYVYMLGFAAGQPYLGDLPESFSIPRRATPVPHMPAGSLVVAAGKAVLYSFDNPTGWYAVGRTPVKLFDHTRDPVALLEAGDIVEFHQIDLQEFRDFDGASLHPLNK